MSRHAPSPAVAEIPLHCNICPKEPYFSDVSHLLTHIGSKGHLSYYFKLKVKAASDPASKRIVDQYDGWYEDYNIQGMMSDRLSQKERKKAGAASRSTADSGSTSAANSVTSSRNSPAVSNLPTRLTRAPRESTALDPQLGARIKQEPKSRSTTPASGFAMDAAAYHRSYAPPMQGWTATPYGIPIMQKNPSNLDSFYSSPSSDSGETDDAFDPRADDDTSHTLSGSRTLSGSIRSLLDDEEEEEEPEKEPTLKGIKWAGMGLFDSATPDMRRQRNQRKAFSVVQSLKATSEIVEPTEQIFDETGALKRERPITGNPEEEDGFSPLLGEAVPDPVHVPPKKKPGRRSRAALAEKNVNTGRTRRKRHEPRRDRSPFGRVDRVAPYFDLVDDDDELTYGRRRPRQCTGLSIHRDNSGPDISFDHPSGMNTLTSGFRNPLQSAFSNGHAFAQGNTNHCGDPRQSRFPFGQTMTMASNDPLTLPPPNLGSFGHLSGSYMSLTSNFHANNPFPVTNGHQSFGAFQPQYGLAPQSFVNENSLFQFPGSDLNGMQNQAPWDLFGGFGQADLGIHDPTEPSFSLPGDLASVNPLFINNAPDDAIGDDAQDDDATLSPQSER